MGGETGVVLSLFSVAPSSLQKKHASEYIFSSFPTICIECHFRVERECAWAERAARRRRDVVMARLWASVNHPLRRRREGEVKRGESLPPCGHMTIRLVHITTQSVGRTEAEVADMTQQRLLAVPEWEREGETEEGGRGGHNIPRTSYLYTT